ncbi:hypothetical protein ACIBL6_17540 [Streptomyces sp. NPDC050400]|uniref:hypothetical protein n=1 Tax=Streptomyces sp. NPDC050400 TaxID=3365610 RepID=UPI00378DCC9C
MERRTSSGAALPSQPPPLPAEQNITPNQHKADPRMIVRDAFGHGFLPDVAHLHEGPDAALTFLFRPTRTTQGASA